MCINVGSYLCIHSQVTYDTRVRHDLLFGYAANPDLDLNLVLDLDLVLSFISSSSIRSRVLRL